jgi:hypothetical protein
VKGLKVLAVVGTPMGSVSLKRGRDMQGQVHRPGSFEENSVLWSVVVRPLLDEETVKGTPVYAAVCMCKSSVLVMLYEQ